MPHPSRSWSRSTTTGSRRGATRAAVALAALGLAVAACSPLPSTRADPAAAAGPTTSADPPTLAASSSIDPPTTTGPVIEFEQARSTTAASRVPAPAGGRTAANVTIARTPASSTTKPALARTSGVARTTTVTVASGGRTRSAVVHTPAVAAGAVVPLVLAFHGSSSSGEELEARTGFDQLADQSGFVVVYPEGVDDGSDDTSRSWNAGQCCPSASSIGVDDVSFVAALVEQLERTMPIDRRRVYLTGHSNGAMMAQRLGCERADLFAAVASVAGTLGIGRCAPSVALSIIEIHGTNDANVNFNSAMSALAQWRGADGCGTTADVSTAASVTTRRWACAHGTDVESIEIAGAQHPWPGARTPAPNGQVTSTAIDATGVVWAFLSEHSRS